MTKPDTVAELKLAREIAYEAHKGQTRKDGSPYIQHPKRVSESLKRSGTGTLSMVVAWLHDVVEDNPEWTLARLIKAGISAEAVEAIGLLTKKKDSSYVKYLEQIKKNKTALAVKVADMVDNLTGDPSAAQKQKYLNGLIFLST